MTSYSSLPNKLISAPNGVDYAYRDTGGGEGGAPLVLLQHFRGNLDSWDPALIDALASARRVIAFDNAGVGGSTGTTPDTVEQMARDAIAFLEAMDLGQVDLLGFSIGSFVAQQIALRRPAIVRRLVLASAAPQGAAGMHRPGPDVSAPSAPRRPAPRNTSTSSSPGPRPAGEARQQALQRMHGRTGDRDTATTWATRLAQYDAVARGGSPITRCSSGSAACRCRCSWRTATTTRCILPHYSYLLAGLIPQARVKMYPDSAHGFLFQHHADFTADVEAFLRDPR